MKSSTLFSGHGRLNRALLAILPILAAVMANGAPPPPALVHYQGLLLDNVGNPVTTSRTIYFTIYEGGDAVTNPSAGTLKYREHAVITPDSRGVFDHQVGSGTIDSGTLTPALFNTAQPLFLEVAVGSVGAVLLPRTRFTSVGYAFVADSANSAAVAGLASAPVVTSVADFTGGLLVIGDVLNIQGSNLANARVLIGGKPAPFVGAPTAAQIKCQVPEGTPMGLNAVTLVDSTGANASSTVAHIDVHRLLVAVRTAGAQGRVSILDANTGSIVREFILSQAVRRVDSGGVPLTLQAGFGHQGALMLIPSGNQYIFPIDLTANPPAEIAPIFQVGSQYRGVAVSPDGLIAAACDFNGVSGTQVRIIPLTKSAPPYAGGVFGASVGLESGEVPAAFGASGVQFIGDGQVVVLGRSFDQIISYQRVPGTTGSNVNDIERILAADLTAINVSDAVNVGGDPARLQLSHDRTRLLVSGISPNNLIALYNSTYWPIGYNPGSGGTAAGVLPFKMAIAPDDQTIFVASHDAANNQANDRLLMFYLVGETLTFRGSIPGPTTTGGVGGGGESFAIADIEPVDGRLLAVATNNNKLYLSPRVGGVVPIDVDTTHSSSTYLSLTNPITLTATTMDCVELAFQP